MANNNTIFRNAKKYLKVSPKEWTRVEVAFYTINTYRNKSNYMCEVLLYKNDEKFISLHSTGEGKYDLKYVNDFIEIALRNCLEIYKKYTHLKIDYKEYVFEENIFNNLSDLISKRNESNE